MDNATRALAPGVPLKITPEIEILVKFNQLSNMALEPRLGTSNVLAIMLAMEEANATELTSFLLGAGLLHRAALANKTGDLVPRLQQVLEGGTTAAAEAARLGRAVMMYFDLGEGRVDAGPMLNALVRAWDIARPLDPCARCGHAISEHDWADGLCHCGCPRYTQACDDCKHVMDGHLADPEVDGSPRRCTEEGCDCVLAEKSAGKAAAPVTTSTPTGAASTESPDVTSALAPTSSGS